MANHTQAEQNWGSAAEWFDRNVKGDTAPTPKADIPPPGSSVNELMDAMRETIIATQQNAVNISEMRQQMANTTPVVMHPEPLVAQSPLPFPVPAFLGPVADIIIFFLGLFGIGRAGRHFQVKYLSSNAPREPMTSTTILGRKDV